MDLDPLTNDDVADILALLDSLPYDEFDLETPRFRLSLRRTPGGWTQSTQVLSAPEPLDGASDRVNAGARNGYIDPTGLGRGGAGSDLNGWVGTSASRGGRGQGRGGGWGW